MKFAQQVKYLGLLLYASVKDDSATQRKMKSLQCSKQAQRHFFLSTSQPRSKNTVFHTYCMPVNYTQSSIKCLCIAYNNGYQIFYYISRDVHVRPHQVTHFVTTFDALIRNNLYAWTPLPWHFKKKVSTWFSAELWSEVLLLGSPKVNEVKNFLPFLKLMKCKQTKFHAHTLREFQVTGQKKVKIYRWSDVSCSTVFSLYRFFIETATDIDMILQVLLRFCNNNGFLAISDVIMLFCPLLDDWILCRVDIVRQETWSYSTWFDKCSIYYACSVSTLWYSQV